MDGSARGSVSLHHLMPSRGGANTSTGPTPGMTRERDAGDNEERPRNYSAAVASRTSSRLGATLPQ